MARKGKIVIHEELCKGCYLCVRACPAGVLAAAGAPAASGVYPAAAAAGGKCVACGGCYAVCPDMCIDVYIAGGGV